MATGPEPNKGQEEEQPAPDRLHDPVEETEVSLTLAITARKRDTKLQIAKRRLPTFKTAPTKGGNAP